MADGVSTEALPAVDAARWFVRLRARAPARLRLFCFPYAGGSASAFRALAQSLPETIEVIAVQLPGRESRFREPPATDFAGLVADLTAAIVHYADLPYATFAHSFGTILSYELVLELTRRGRPLPQHMIMSGRGAPHIRRPDIPERHGLPHAEFVSALRKIKGTPGELLDDPEMMELLVPMLRADFAMAETYRCDRRAPLPCGVSAYGGIADSEVDRNELQAWQEYSSGTLKLRMFPGDHFFIHGRQGLLERALVEDLHTGCAALR